MAIQPSDLVIPDLGIGLDTFSSPGNLADGAHQVLYNVDPKSNGDVETRKGFQRYYGGIPLRATRITKSGTTITMEFDSSQTISLITSGVGPLLLAGKLPDVPGVTGNGDLSTNFNSIWYPEVRLTFRENFSAGANILVKTAEQTGWTSSLGMVGIALSEASSSATNTELTPGNVQIDQTSFDIETTYISANPFSGFFYHKETKPEAGRTYIKSVSTGDGLSYTINASEHALNTLNIIPILFLDTGTDNQVVEPSAIEISSTGTVTITVDTALDGYIVLYACDAENTFSASCDPGTTEIIVPGVPNPFNFTSIWYLQGGVKHHITPGKVRWDADLQALSITYYLGVIAEAVEIYWTPAEFTANIISVTDTTGVSESYVVDDPQVSVYGIPHEGIYKDPDSEGGWLNHLDSYRNDLEARVVSGLGGNLFHALTRSEAGVTYRMPVYRVWGSNRAIGDNRLAPLFAEAGATYSRTRGLIEDASIKSGGARVSSIQYESEGVQLITLTFTGKSAPLTWGVEIDGLDKLTIWNTGKKRNSGDFTILGVVSDSPEETVLRIANPQASPKINESGIFAKANVRTDVINVDGSLTFGAGDRMALVSSNQTLSVYATEPGIIRVEGLLTWFAIPDGVNTYVQRTSRTLPLNTFGVQSVENLVRGDSVTLTGLARLITVKNVIPYADTSITIDVVEGRGSVALANHNLNLEQTIHLLHGGEGVDGDHQILDVIDDDNFVVSLDMPDGTYTATLMGYSIEIDEALTYKAGPSEVLVSVPGRWASVEVPDSLQEKAVRTKERHFDENSYTTQPYIHSSMANDSLYLSNGSDEVKKYDGSTLSNSGIVPWQAWAFMALDETTKSLYGGSSVEFTDVSITDKYFVIPSQAVKVGQRVKESSTGQIYTISLVEADASSGTAVVYRAYVVEDIDVSTDSTGKLTTPNRHRYYVKVSAVDANQNILSSATLGADDLYVDIFDAAAPVLKLSGLPAFSEIDYDSMQLSVYRTAANTVAPFYQVRLVNINYNNGGGYAVIKDTVPDAALTIADLDPTVSVLTGGELGVSWTNPPKATSITTASNRLVLLNIKSPPTLDITFRKSDLVADTALVDYVGGAIRIQDVLASPIVSTFNDQLIFSLEGASASKALTALTYTSDGFTFEAATLSAGAGSWIYLHHSTEGLNKDLTLAGWYRIHAVEEGVYEVKTLHGQAAGAAPVNSVDRVVVSSSSALNAGQRVPVYLGVDGNYLQYVNSTMTLESLVAQRLSTALCAVQSVDAGNNPYWASESAVPTPWLRAVSGRSFRDGSISIYQVGAPSGQLRVTFTGLSSNVQMYVNDYRYGNSDPADSQIRLFPSRLVKSYPNFPELFDDPYGAEGGDSVIDIDPDDGQEGVAVIPFFGSSVFGAAQLTQNVVVFKANSVHLVNLETGERQKLQTNGQGCTAPRSIAVTRNGIMFANRSGVYRLGWDMQVSWIGRNLKGEFDDNLALDSMGDMAGHNYAQDRKYKLSYTVTGRNKNTNVFVYDHSREELGQQGAWSIYTNHDSTGWANLGEDAYWGSTRGIVYQLRNTGEKSDYRDDASPVAEQVLETGGMHAGLPGQRKLIFNATYQFRSPTPMTQLKLESEQDLDGDFQDAGSISVEAGDNTVKYSLNNQKGVYVRLRLSKSGTMDEKLIVSKLSLAVGAIGGQGVQQQKQVE